MNFIKKARLLKNLFPLLFIVSACAHESTMQENPACAEFEKLVDSTYNFKPSKLAGSEKDAKSRAMDNFWNKVKADPNRFLPCLREAIKSRKSDSFFRFDASNLLFQLDQSAEAKKTLIEAYAGADLDDINLAYWLPYIGKLGYEDFDTTAAGETWLKYPNPEYYLPQHGTVPVNKEVGAFVIYGSMDESMATPALAKIAAQKDHPAREIAVRVLLQQVTAEAFGELKKLDQNGLSETTRQSINALLTKPDFLAPREGAPKITREQYIDAFQQLTNGKSEAFFKLAARVPDGEKDAVAVMKPEDVPLIRKARRVFASNATPHTPEWYKSFTDILTALVWKPELVK